MASKSNAVASENGNVVTKPTPFQIMLRAMSMDASAEDSTFAGDDLNAILEATTEEEMWDADEQPPLNFQHLAGCEIGVIDFQVKYSRASRSDIATPFTVKDEKGNDKKMYLLVSCVRLSDAGEKPVIKLPAVGEVFQANTSARFIVAKLWKALTLGMINKETGKVLECMIQEIDLGDGTGVLKLRPMPKRTVRATAE